MAKQRFDSDRCLKDLTARQRQRLPDAVGKFLLDSVDGSLEALFYLKPSKFKDLAFDFVESETGKNLWPLSDMGQWQGPASSEETQRFVANVMAEQRKKHTEHNPAFMVDLDKRAGPSKGPKTPSRAAPVQRTLVTSGEKGSPSVVRIGSKQGTPATKSFSQESYEPAETVREDSQVDENDIPFEQPGPQRTPTLKRSILPTTASHLIALGPGSASDDSRTALASDQDSDTIQVGGAAPPTPKLSSKSAGTKRPVEDLNEGNQAPLTPPTPTRRPHKRVAVEIPSRRPETEDVQRLVVDLEAPGGASSDPPQMPPTPVTALPAPPSNSDTAAEPPGPLVQAFGLQFTAEKFAALPRRALEYLELVQDENLRTADFMDEEQDRNHFQFRAELCNQLSTDFQSIIRGMTVDAKEKNWRERTYAVVSSRRPKS